MDVLQINKRYVIWTILLYVRAFYFGLFSYPCVVFRILFEANV